MKLNKQILLGMSIAQMRQLVAMKGIQGEFTKRSRSRPTEYRTALFTALVKHKVPKCVICKEPCRLEPRLDYHVTCGCRTCLVQNAKNESKKALKSKYGVTNASQIPGVREKKIETCRKNHGCDFPSQSKKIRKKIEQSMLDRYGVSNASQSEEIKAKRDRTFLERFGGNPFANAKVKEKIQKYARATFGVDYVAQAPEIRAKMRRTLMKNLGVDVPAKSEQVRYKMRETSKQRYGVDHPMKVAEISAKVRKAWAKVDKAEVRKRVETTSQERYGARHHTLRDGYREHVQKLLESKFSPEEIKQKRKNAGQASAAAWRCLTPGDRQKRLEQVFIKKRVFAKHDIEKLLPLQGYEAAFVDYVHARSPKARFKRPEEVEYTFNAYKRTYFPDLEILLNGNTFVVEVKSVYTLQCDLARNLAKFRAADKFCTRVNKFFRVVVLHKNQWYKFSATNIPKTRKQVDSFFD